MFDTLVIGAGQAGLAAGYHLQRAGINFAILDANPQVGGSWQHYWDSLRLFSPARYSQLPGMAFPGHPMRYPTRDDVIAYLQDYATHFNMDVRTGVRICEIYKHGEFFTLETAGGARYQARSVIVAVGVFNRPYIPDIPGQFNGHTLHSFDYRTPEPFRGQRVIVVGANNSAVQIGYELAQVAHVSLAVRRPIVWRSKQILGKNLFFWIHRTGLDMIPLGHFIHLSDNNWVIDDGTYRRAVNAGHPNTRRMFTALTHDGVIWPGNHYEPVDTILYATGYTQTNIPFLQKLGALCPHDHTPLQRGGISTAIDGLYYVGVFGQRTAASATLRGVGADAAYVVSHLCRKIHCP